MTIKVLGPGCTNCRTLEHRTLEALQQLNMQASVDKVTDIDGMVSYGVMRTPGLVIDEKLVWQGGVPTVEKIKEIITASGKAI
jgi:small redox-active disulfide protein 2